MADVKAAHKRSIRHRDEVLNSSKCGCFYCLAIFPPNSIKDWCDDQWHEDGATALCPHCGIESVIGDKSGFEISEHFLRQMHQHWF